MGKTTILTAENFTLTTGIRQPIFIRTAAAGNAASHVEIKRVELTQNNQTALAMCRIGFATQTGTTVTATATTPVTIRPLGGAASGLSGNTAPAGGDGRTGTNLSVNTTPGYTYHHYANFPNLNGYLWKPSPDEQIWIPPSTMWGIVFLADPTLAGWTVSVTLEEN